MRKYLIDYSVNGSRTQQIITANSRTDAERILKAQYPTARITIWSVKDVR